MEEGAGLGSAPPAPAAAEASQLELKEEAIKHLTSLHNGGVSEEQGKVIYDRYDSGGKGLWTVSDLRLFLFDLEESFHCLRVVPDEALMDVLRELQLNVSDHQAVSWVEFKSYLIYLQAVPLNSLHEIVQRVVSAEKLRAAVVVSSAAGVTKEHLHAVFSQCGTVSDVFIARDLATEALVCFALPASAAEALRFDGAEILKAKITVEAIRADTEFPHRAYQRQPRLVARTIAKVYVDLKDFSDRHQLMEKLRLHSANVSERLERYKEENKVNERLRAAGDQTHQAIRGIDERLKISEKVSSVDEKYQLSQKAAQAKEVVKDKVGQIMENPHVQKATGMLTDALGRLYKVGRDFQEETRLAIEERQRAKQGQPEFEMAPEAVPREAAVPAATAPEAAAQPAAEEGEK